MDRYDIALKKQPTKVINDLPTFKVFEAEGKINFIDKNNVFVGYDLSQSCCESADWFITDKFIEQWPEKEEKIFDLNGFVFDKDFFRLINSDADGIRYLDEGGMVVFKLVKTTGSIYQEKYLYLYNCQNGYYGHGFEMKIGETEIRADYI